MTFRLQMPGAARYDTVTIRVSLFYACLGIVSDDPDKARLTGCCQSGGLYFFIYHRCFPPVSTSLKKTIERLPADGSEAHFEPVGEIKIYSGKTTDSQAGDGRENAC